MIQAVIVEDEQQSVEALQLLLSEYCKDIKVIKIVNSASAGVKAILEFKPDLVFLDIKLKGASGFDLLESFDKINFEIIFTTAYDEFAIKAFEFSALDYLLKPIEPEALQRAYQKILDQIKGSEGHQYYSLLKSMINGSREEQRIALPSSEGYIFVKLKDIVRCEASNHYTNFYLTDGSKLTVSRTLKEYDKLLLEYDFYRVHQSHLINLKHLLKYVRVDGVHVVMNDGSSVPISKRRRNRFNEMVSAHDEVGLGM